MKGAKATPRKTPAQEEAAAAGAREAKHKQENRDIGNDKDQPKKKLKSGKCQQMRQQPKSSHRKRDAPVYAAGSLEEQWQLEILSRGRVTCPTCRAVARKTVEGLKKHMSNCQQEMLTCHHCGKQLRSLAGMKYHIMADHNSLALGTEPAVAGVCALGEREHLRRMLKRMGKLRCRRQGCTGSFTSVLGFLYHMRKCGKEAAELEKMALKCHHCTKAYRSKAGLAYHLKMEHGPQVSLLGQEIQPAPPREEASAEPSSGGHRALRKSAQAAAHLLQEALAKEALDREWPRRKVWQDLVPEDHKLKYTRPGLPAVSQEVLSKWKVEIKACRHIRCPNQGCQCVYSSISGLKSHLGSCTLGEVVAGRYRCLLCEKEFASESGVKYHINTVHAQDWFAIGTHTTKNIRRLLKRRPQEEAEQKSVPRKPLPAGSCKKRPRTAASPKPSRQEAAAGEQGQPQPLKASCAQKAGSGSCEEEEEEEEEDGGPPPLKFSPRRERE